LGHGRGYRRPTPPFPRRNLPLSANGLGRCCAPIVWYRRRPLMRQRCLTGPGMLITATVLSCFVLGEESAYGLHSDESIGSQARIAVDPTF
jgi:hypothetical protein